MSGSIARDSLVLYKSGPARVKSIGPKIELELAGGKTLSVRPKDVLLLHPGPLTNLTSLGNKPAGELEAAWELVAGETTDLAAQHLFSLVPRDLLPFFCTLIQLSDHRV